MTNTTPRKAKIILNQVIAGVGLPRIAWKITFIGILRDITTIATCRGRMPRTVCRQIVPEPESGKYGTCKEHSDQVHVAHLVIVRVDDEFLLGYDDVAQGYPN